uniref:hypothetical protein n=1 Tax=Rhodanobacter glycinis TaxID=582702 RepID=UPI001C0EF6DA|nr:hypothetical protein [Rhodanobacter glycinis]
MSTNRKERPNTVQGNRGKGRPKGAKNKVTAEIREIAQPYGEEAVTTLVKIMRGNEQPTAARVAAAKEILDRGYGKSVQKTDLTSSDGTMTPRGLSDFYAGLQSSSESADT